MDGRPEGNMVCEGRRQAMATKIYRDKKFWNKVKHEYLEGDGTKPEIAKRHNLSLNTLNSRIKNEHWAKDKEEYRKKHKPKEEVFADAKERYDKDNDAICRDIGKTLLSKIAMSIDRLDVEDRAGIRQITASLKDLKELRLWADTLNEIEQKARIEKLQAEAKDKEPTSIDINVSFCNDWDEDRYTEVNVLAVRKNRKGEIVVHYECDGEEYEDDIMLYSFDEIYKIAMAVVSKC